ncbi:abc transporter family protein [Stylonychia lemnae]|uniref:Abc transporter family protein n=1 Tax=Stylonychia lemnae TaxID=5949 RepID=A0A078B2B3_STYLE|nr:abc transporter family protein [Stylonychia lemnae]|eukprot:CDW88685.1 abc transporter family protein [Stylonychia lemnae]
MIQEYSSPSVTDLETQNNTENQLITRNQLSKLSFENLSEKEKFASFYKQEILKGVTGNAIPGETLFIMGSSGAGKTTLLNILSDRVSLKSTSKLSGKVLINGCTNLNQRTFGNIGAYVMQDDILFPHFTPRQALTFAARLKLNNLSEDDQDLRVESLILELGLKQCADSMIGSSKRKILSGGEKKRVSIGIELITDPKLLLLDEPTSVIATIHQPGSQAFSNFDRLFLMCDGFVVFQGKASEVSQYFSKIGFNCPRYSNPADFIINTTSIDYPKRVNDEKKISYLVLKYKEVIPDVIDHDLNSYNILAFQGERPVFLRESANKMYGVFPYYIAKTIVEIPVLIFQPMIWSLIVYFGVGLTVTVKQFWYHYLVLVLLSLSSSSFGLFISSLFESEETAVTVAPVILMPFILFSGYFSNASSYPKWIGWIQYISPVRYSLEAFVINEFESRDYKDTDIKIIDFLSYDIGFTSCLLSLFTLGIAFRILTGLVLKYFVRKFQ